MKLRKANINGQPGWCVDYGVRDGARRRRYFVDLKEAQTALKEGEKAAKAVGRSWTELSPAERADAVGILKEIKARGLTFRSVWASFQSGINVNLTGTKTLTEAIGELLKAKAGANRRQVYLTSLEGYLRRFAKGREARPVSSVALEEIEAFVNSAASPGSRSTTLNRVGTLFSFATRRGWCAFNPCARVEKSKVEVGVPEILTVDEAKKALRFTRQNMPGFLPWLAAGMFAGLRPGELDGLTWDAVNLDRGIITIDAPTTKVRQRRIVHLRPAAVAWLQLGGELPMVLATRRRCLRRLRTAMGWQEWPKDCLRHTAASYWLAAVPDAQAVALELGNSPGILHRHYRDLIREEGAVEQFWALTPEQCEKGEA